MIPTNDNAQIYLNQCPQGLSSAYGILFSDGCLRFLIDLAVTFDSQCDKVRCHILCNVLMCAFLCMRNS